jgi:hypothetical protein
MLKANMMTLSLSHTRYYHRRGHHDRVRTIVTLSSIVVTLTRLNTALAMTEARILRLVGDVRCSSLVRLRMGVIPKRVQWTRWLTAEGLSVSRNRSPCFSLGYLLAVAMIVLLIILLVLWLL